MVRSSIQVVAKLPRWPYLDRLALFLVRRAVLASYRLTWGRSCRLILGFQGAFVGDDDLICHCCPPMEVALVSRIVSPPRSGQLPGLTISRRVRPCSSVGCSTKPRN